MLQCRPRLMPNACNDQQSPVMIIAHGLNVRFSTLTRSIQFQRVNDLTALTSRLAKQHISFISSRPCLREKLLVASSLNASTSKDHDRPVTVWKCYHEQGTSSNGPFSSSPSKRRFSTWRRLRDGWWGRSHSSSRAAHESGYRDDDLLPFLGVDEQSGLGGRILKPSNELRMRCTEFDENGNVVLVSGEFKKHELIAKYSLLPRDLRKIDSSVLPSILVRPSAILINLLHIRCLIKYNRVLVFDVYGSTDSYAQSLFMYDLEGKLRQKQTSTTAGGALPYEFRALEAILISVTNGMESEFEGVREPVLRVLRELEEDIDRDKLRHLLIYSKKLSTFEQKARLVRDAIDEILEADDDLAAMYLTEKQAGGGREEDNHEEIELLLESYYNVADEICQVSSNLVGSIKNTEEIIRAILDSNRNSLMLLDLKVSIWTLGTTAGMFIAALYGMNLVNFIEDSPYGFIAMSGLCVGLAAVASVVGLKRLRKLQRVRMWSDQKSIKEARARAFKMRKESLQQIARESSHERGLGETIAGIGSREALSNWKREHNERAKRFARSKKHSEAGAGADSGTWSEQEAVARSAR